MKEYYRYERLIFSRLKELGFQPNAIFDVGSSHAGWSRVVASVFPSAEFHLFEPLVDFKPFYKAQSDLSIAANPNFSLHKIALGDRNQDVRLFSDVEGYSASVLRSPTAFPERFDVRMATLKAYVSEKALPTPDILKMDVQGGELLVLRGAGDLVDAIRVLQAETWFVRGYGPETPLFYEVMEFLRSKGLLLFELGERFYDDAHQLYCCDAFFVKADLLDAWRGKLPAEPIGESLS